MYFLDRLIYFKQFRINRLSIFLAISNNAITKIREIQIDKLLNDVVANDDWYMYIHDV